MFNSRNTRRRCDVFKASKVKGVVLMMTSLTLDYFTPCSSVFFIVDLQRVFVC